MQAQPRSTARRGRPVNAPAQPAHIGRRVPKKRYEDQLEDYEIRYEKPERKFDVIPAEKQRFRKPVATVRPLVVQDKPGSQQPNRRRARRVRKQSQSSAKDGEQPREQSRDPARKEDREDKDEKHKDRPALENEVRVNRYRDAGFFAYQVRSKLKDNEVVICSAIGPDTQRKISFMNRLLSKEAGFCLAFRTDVIVLGKSGRAKLRFLYKKGENFEEVSKKLDEQFSERMAKRDAEKKSKEDSSEGNSEEKSEEKSEEQPEEKAKEHPEVKAEELGESKKEGSE